MFDAGQLFKFANTSMVERCLERSCFEVVSFRRGSRWSMGVYDGRDL